MYVGLPDASVKESKDRVVAALYSNDCEVADKRIIINLSPAEQKKSASTLVSPEKPKQDPEMAEYAM